ncbi:hypothetical protein L7F22_032534 [Adiantum nelumboides]|nr:hypothetical protein [Adiantum nelumboides]
MDDMAEIVSTEAPLKRKLDGSSEAIECKKPRDCSSASEPAPGYSQEAPAQSNGDHKTANLLNLSGEAGLNAAELPEEQHKNDECSFEDLELKLSTRAPGSSSASLQEIEAISEGEVLEQDEAVEENDSGERSGLDTENDSDNEGEYGSDDDEDDSDDEEDDEEDASDNAEGAERMVISTSSSFQAEAAHKDKGKAKLDDAKGKSIMPLDKGKGKAVAEDETAPASDEDDAGYLSEDLLEEVDLNNILPTRTRKRSSIQHYDFVEQGDNEDDEDDSDA